MAESKPIPAAPGAYRLVKDGVVIYVGSTDDLLRRYNEWCKDPGQNPCVQARGFDEFVWHPAGSVSEAQALECDWVRQYNPPCDRQKPPGF